jgi:hypothetical protein
VGWHILPDFRKGGGHGGAFDSVVLRTADYLGLFAEAGLAAEVFADYTERQADGQETLSCFVCRGES